MAVVTSQKITNYYERFKGIDVTFTKDIIQVTGLMPQQVHLKCGSDFWPCVVYCSSFESAKIVANIKSGLMEKLATTNNYASLRYSFKVPESANPVVFFVSTRVMGQSPYANSQDAAILSLQFTQRPPDDLIGIMGRLLDANVNSTKRKDERITITADTQRKLAIQAKECAVFIQGVPRRCILRDVSFSGAKVIMMGVAKFLVDKEIGLRLDFDDPREVFMIKGKFVRAEAVEGKPELLALAVQYDENHIPMSYKIRINDFLSTNRAENRTAAVEKEEKAEEHAAKVAASNPAQFSIPEDGESGHPQAGDKVTPASTSGGTAKPPAAKPAAAPAPTPS